MALKFEKIRIDDVRYEAAEVFDVNNDGKLDIVCGEYWYEAPNWIKHKICDVRAEGEYYDDFSDIPMDVDGDGYLDIVTGGWFGETLQWRRNPGAKGGDWSVHDIDKPGHIETTRAFDIDGDGQLEICPNCPGSGVMYYKLILDDKGRGTGKFKRVDIWDKATHGMGFGDVAGNGRCDYVLANGWLEAPQDPEKGSWTFHEEFDLGSASCPVLVHDVNGDGLADLIVGQSHAYGLAWWQQGRDASGRRTWAKHDIDPDCSQYHDVQLHDIDNDGQLELVTGKRYRAHCGNDPGADDPVGVYYFKIDGGKFVKHVIDFGPVPKHSGVGIYFAVRDLDGNGWLDVVAPGKDGLYLFRNLGK
ncbi:MAG: VCBS repeat-containing protein [Phycisphaerae bacterium]|nr:VCBS repeat-containing protein [Phycisphaerae bacterium]